MELTLTRILKHKSFTQGTLSIEGEPFCVTLEPGRTPIPEGRYPLLVTRSPKFDNQWLPLLLHVPGFTGIRIHAGNTAEDTAGCILTGFTLDNHPGRLFDSRAWLQRLLRRLAERPEGEGVWITVK